VCHVWDPRLFVAEPQFHPPQLLIGRRHLIPKHPALLHQPRSVTGRCFGNLRGNVFLLPPEFIAACDQFIAFLPQSQHGIDIRLHAAFAAVFDNFVPMIADELQIQH
jgi:hypothetical protein